MIRQYGRATPGQRVVEQVPDNDGNSDTMLAAVGLDGLQAPWGVDGAMKGDILRCSGHDSLGPTLRPGDMVLWEHLSAHNVAGVEELLTARGAQLIRLSPSSPDFNPMEPCWSQIKTVWRRAKARTVEALIDAMKHALDTVTTADMCRWLKPCGYPLQWDATRSRGTPAACAAARCLLFSLSNTQIVVQHTWCRCGYSRIAWYPETGAGYLADAKPIEQLRRGVAATPTRAPRSPA
jgi:transposase